MKRCFGMAWDWWRNYCMISSGSSLRNNVFLEWVERQIVKTATGGVCQYKRHLVSLRVKASCQNTLFLCCTLKYRLSSMTGSYFKYLLYKSTILQIPVSHIRPGFIKCINIWIFFSHIRGINYPFLAYIYFHFLYKAIFKYYFFSSRFWTVYKIY